MSTHRITLSIVAVVLVILIFNLPKVVVDNDAADTGVGEVEHRGGSAAHAFEMEARDSLRIVNFRKQIAVNGNNSKSTRFADSLANLYLAYNQLDSAEKYAEFILAKSDDLENHRMAGEIYFKAFGFSSDQQQAKRYADLAAESFESILTKEPNNPNVRAKMGMTMVNKANPMQGVQMLKSVLEDYPNNETALYNLGVLSMQSGQYDKAAERFEKLIEVNTRHVQASFYLAVSYFELEEKEKAADLFGRVKAMNDDPAILQAVDGYLKEINDL